MNYMITKSKTRGAQPESPAPKKRTLFYAKCYKNEDKKRKLDTLKNCLNYNILEQSSKPYTCQKSAIGKKHYINLKIFLSLFINYVKNINETHPPLKKGISRTLSYNARGQKPPIVMID